jgi:hypothetical protein
MQKKAPLCEGKSKEFLKTFDKKNSKLHKLLVGNILYIYNMNKNRTLKYSIFTLLMLCTLLSKAQSRDLWMFGPMMHINFGDKKIRTSYAIEFSYWNYQRLPYSFDFGLEFERGKMRLYSEAQTGLLLAGISAGPVLERDFENQKFNVGFQGSAWANYFMGVDLRARLIGGKGYICPGTYLKLPLIIFSKDFHNNSNNNSSGWDWDD